MSEALSAQLAPLVDALGRHEVVRAAAVVGSRSSGRAREHSDIDLFVYVVDGRGDEVLAVRRTLAAGLADPAHAVIVEQTGHGYADVWMLRGTDVYLDLMFWTDAWAEEELDWRLVRHSRQMGGASTAFWRSIRDGLPLLDRDGWLERLQQRARSPFPEELRAAIVGDDLDLLGTENPFSFLHQVGRAVIERDRVAVNHRVAKWLEAYFDLLFGANRVLHPGEKRLVAFVEAECERRPAGLGEEVDRLLDLAAALAPDTTAHMERMLGEAVDVLGLRSS